jgi:hypothetical protein
MPDFSVRSDSVDVEQIMKQIRERIREKRGVDYTEEEIRELANVKLEKFLDPRGVRSDLLKEFQRARAGALAPPNFSFEEDTLFTSSRPIIRLVRRLLKPILKLFFSPNPLVYALHAQAELNTRNAQHTELQFELLHNLVLEITRLGIEVKNLKMRLESMSSRLDFDERRARALEGVVQYRPGAVAPLQPGGTAGEPSQGQGGPDAADRRSRRRRRRGRKRPGTEGRPPGQPGTVHGPHSAAGSSSLQGEASSTPAPDNAPSDQRERNQASGDPSTGSASSRSEPRVEARAERSELGGVQPSSPEATAARRSAEREGGETPPANR